jgi:hypothetical protein
MLKQVGLIYCNECGHFHSLFVSPDGKQFLFPDWIPFETVYAAN